MPATHRLRLVMPWSGACRLWLVEDALDQQRVWRGLALRSASGRVPRARALPQDLLGLGSYSGPPTPARGSCGAGNWPSGDRARPRCGQAQDIGDQDVGNRAV